jgi:hypothetical protein
MERRDNVGGTQAFLTFLHETVFGGAREFLALWAYRLRLARLPFAFLQEAVDELDCPTKNPGSSGAPFSREMLCTVLRTPGHVFPPLGFRRRLSLPAPIFFERSVACFGDFQPFDFERLLKFANHALSGQGGESGAHQLCQLVGREAVHTHGWFGAACRTATGEQRKRAAPIGTWAARWSGARHCVIPTPARLGENY